MFNFTRKFVKALTPALLIIALMLITACSGDDNPTGSSPAKSPMLAKFIGTYDSQYRWGGDSGLWRGTADLQVTSDGKVYYRGTMIKNPSVTESSVSWLIADGNPHQAAITFQDSDNRSYYWSDKGSVSFSNFTGWLQNPGEGKLDFRGLIQ